MSIFVQVYQIFNISDPMDENTYIGSTTSNITHRMGIHRYYCNKEDHKAHNRDVYKYIRAHGGWDCFGYMIIDTGLVNSKSEQLQLEQENMDLEHPTLNTRPAYQTKEQLRQRQNEYDELHKEHLKVKAAELRERNRPAARIKQATYREANREKINADHARWVRENADHVKAYKKAYRLKNKAKTAARMKANYQKNKARIKAQQDERVTCECGAQVRRGGMAKHRRTAKHTLGLE
jgi:membrane protein involved in colicin uptake